MATNAKSRKAARYAVPVAVAGVAAATVAMVPAFANAGSPDLPKVTAQQLIEKVAASDVEQFSGSAKISTDLGLPSFAGGLLGAAGGGGGVAGGSADPQEKLARLASGSHTLRVAVDGPDRQKITFVDGKDEYSLIHNGADVWGHDSKANEVWHEKDPEAGKAAGQDHKKTADRLGASPQEMAQELLKAAGPTTDISVGDNAQVAGRDAYQLVLKPKQSGSTVGSVKIAVDAKNGVPLRVQLLAAEGGKPIVDAGFTKVDFARPAADTFAFTPPKGAKVTEGKAGGPEGGPGHGKDFKGLEAFPGLGAITGGAGGKGGNGDTKVLGEGWATIARIDTGAGRSLKELENDKNAPKEAKQFLNSLGDKVSGGFGEGRVFKTRLVNALITDDGKVYVGAVTKDALVQAATANK